MLAEVIELLDIGPDRVVVLLPSREVITEREKARLGPRMTSWTWRSSGSVRLSAT